jgi:filamentous hemagglutinin family protein
MLNKKNRISKLKPLHFSSLASALCTCLSIQVYANPHGASIESGSASMVSSGHTLTITNLPGTIINWDSFSINKGELTQFIQQNAASQVLNRVTGADPSQILGSLQSNGQVFLINPNGIAFGADARVDVAGLVVSTLNLSSGNFLAGQLNFEAQNNAGAINNQGHLTVNEGGQIILIAPNIENSGIIRAPNGDILLAAGTSVSIVDINHPGISVEISANATQALNVGELIAKNISIYGGIVTNSGEINANTAVVGENGKIILDAQENLTTTATSSITANGVNGGTVVLASQGTSLIAGTIEAKGVEIPTAEIANQTASVIAGLNTVNNVVTPQVTSGLGGTIVVLGHQIALMDDANLDVSGNHGGGTVLVGGDEHGVASPMLLELVSQLPSFIPTPIINTTQSAFASPIVTQQVVSATSVPSNTLNPSLPLTPGQIPLLTASVVWVSSSARIRADAEETGDGGKIILWSEDATRMYGQISAQGGTLSGNGGFVETSGKNYLTVLNVPNLTAANGLGGTWLLDPNNITIQASGSDTNVSTAKDLSGNPTFSTTNDSSVISISTIETALNSGANVTIYTGSGGSNTQAGDINVDAAIVKTWGSDATLTLCAYNNININNSIISRGGELNLVLGADTGSINLANTITLNANGGTINAQGQTVNLLSGTSIINSDFTVATLNLQSGTLAGSGNVTVTSALNVTHNNVTLYGSGSLNTQGTSLIDMTSAAVHDLFMMGGKTWNNSGALTLAGSSFIYFGPFGNNVFNNLQGGTVNINTSESVPFNLIAGTATFNNAGTLNFAGADNYSLKAGIGFNNTGLVNVSAETTLSLANMQFANTGNINNLGVLQLSGVHDTGTGNITNSGVLTLLNTSLANYILNQGSTDMNTVRLSSQFTNGGLLSLSGSNDLAGGLQLLADSSITGGNGVSVNLEQQAVLLSGTGSYAISDVAFKNIGNSLVDTGQSLSLNNVALAGQGLLTVNGAVNLNNTQMDMAMAVNNYGILSQLSGVSTINQPLNNVGTLEVSSGRLTILGGGVESGVMFVQPNAVLSFAGSQNFTNTSLLGGGTVDFAAGTYTGAGSLLNADNVSMSGNALFTVSVLNSGNWHINGQAVTFASGYSQTAGQTWIDSGILTANYMQNGGILSGPGLINGDVNILAGTLMPSNTNGLLSINGNLNLAPTAQLEMNLAGSAQGLSYDYINVSQAANLAGSLNVIQAAGYTPLTGSNFYIMNFASSTGRFSLVNLPSNSWLAAYNPNSVELSLTNSQAGGLSMQTPAINGNDIQSQTLLQTLLQGDLQNPLTVGSAFTSPTLGTTLLTNLSSNISFSGLWSAEQMVVPPVTYENKVNSASSVGCH